MSAAARGAPSLAEFLAMVEAAFDDLPEVFRARCETVALRVADLADRETLDALEIDDPMDLTGLYRGVDLPRRSWMDPPGLPDEVWLYRLPILAEWRERGDVALDRLIMHVLVHEIAHHFGLSDEDILEIDDWRL